jgi:hypothetical protein
VETDRDAVWEKLGFPDRRNINVTTSDEPMDISYSLEELQVLRIIMFLRIFQYEYMV